MEQKRKVQNDKPKLIKRDSKIKKVNNPINNNIGVKNNKKITPITKTNKSTIDSSSNKKRKINDIQQNKVINTNKVKKNLNNNDNKNIKQRFEDYILQQNKNEDKIIKKKRFNNIDEAVLLIQRCFREYLDKIHNTNSNLMKLINQRKKNLLDNYNNDNEIMFDLYQKNNSDKKNKKLNEDIIIEDKKNSDENKFNNNKDIISKKNLNINIDIDDTNSNKEKYTNKISKNNNDDNNNNNQYSVFERIYKKMQNQEQSKNDTNNDNITNNKYGLDDDLIEKKDNIIDNQFDLIKNIQKRAIENISVYKNTEDENNFNNKTENQEELNENIKEDIKQDLKEEIIEEKKEEKKELESNQNINNNDELKEKIQEKKDIEEKEENKNSIIENNIKEKNIIEKSSNEKNENEKSSKNEIFQRLANFLDSTVENPEKITEPSKKEGIEFQTEISNNPKETTENILSKDNSENIALNLELKEAKKTIDTMSSVINDLKLQLKSKDDFLNKALLSQKNENDILLQRQNTLMESLISEKRNMEMQLSELQSKLNEAEKINYKKLQKMRENYETETRKNKEAWFQAEKIRRKKWEENKIKEIKELTAKGLEPEVERIISNHKNEMS